MTAQPPEASPDELAERLRQSVERSAFATVTPGSTPTAHDIWSAVGGVRGVVESVAPGVVFLVVFSLTGNLVWSVSAPALIALGFTVLRLVQRQAVQSALAGVLGIVASAAVAILSGSAANYFSLGLWVNLGGFLAMLMSIVLKRPIIGIVSSILVSDPTWREDRAVVTMATIATWLWVGLFAARLAVQTPLYLLEAVAQLAMARLVMGVPLYALALWMSWLLMRSVYRERETPHGAKI